MEQKVVVLSPRLRLYNLILLFFFSLYASPSSSELSFNFYAASCPSAEFIVKNTVSSASSLDPTIPAKLLRLLFHDCMVEVRNFSWSVKKEGEKNILQIFCGNF